jgi:acetyl esterase/lipase
VIRYRRQLGFRRGLALLYVSTIPVVLALSASGTAADAPTAQAGATEPAPREELLWPNGAQEEARGLFPESESIVDRNRDASGLPDRVASNVSSPTITVFPAVRDKATGVAIAIFPGGGFRGVGIDFSYAVARKLNEMGITAAFVKYRTLPVDREGRILESVRAMAFLGTLADGRRAVRTLRGRAAEWGIDPRRVGVLGFSAGGHLAVSVMLAAEEKKGRVTDAIDSVSSRPDFAALVYPGLDDSMLPKVKKGLCPTFIVTALDDGVVLQQPVALFEALRRAGVPAELHAFQSGGHGFGQGKTMGTKTWPYLFGAWLTESVLVAP